MKERNDVEGCNDCIHSSLFASPSAQQGYRNGHIHRPDTRHKWGDHMADKRRLVYARASKNRELGFRMERQSRELN